MMKRVLITGFTGLIGRQSIEPLRAMGFEIVGLSREPVDVPGVEVIVADLLNADARQAAVKQADATHLLHLAWHDEPQGRWSAPENQDWSLATLQLVNEFKNSGGTRAVCVGTCAEYDWSYEVLTEATPLRPSTEYGQAKASTGTTLCELAPELGLSLAWARVFFCYGPGEPRGRLLGDLLFGLSAGQTVACTDGAQERDYMHTSDIATALSTVLDSDTTGAINIASGETIQVKDLITTAADLMERPDLIALGARERPADDPPRLSADVTRLTAAGFTPKFDLHSGLQDCVKYLETRSTLGAAE